MNNFLSLTIILLLTSMAGIAGPGSTGYGMAENMDERRHEATCKAIELLVTERAFTDWSFQLNFENIYTKDSNSELLMRSNTAIFIPQIRNAHESRNIIKQEIDRTKSNQGSIELSKLQFFKLADCTIN